MRYHHPFTTFFISFPSYRNKALLKITTEWHPSGIIPGFRPDTASQAGVFLLYGKRGLMESSAKICKPIITPARVVMGKLVY